MSDGWGCLLSFFCAIGNEWRKKQCQEQKENLYFLLQLLRG